MPATQAVLILKVAPSGESFLRLDALGAEDGSLICLKRVSSKQPTKDRPDLFDTAELQLEPAKSGNTLFVRDYRVLQRRESIGQSYRSLEYASDYAVLLARNATHMPDPAALYRLAERTLDAFAERNAPAIVYLKGLYLLLQTEGFPVRESWWPQVPHTLREAAKRIINQPTPEAADKELLTICEAISENLKRWIKRETDLIIY